MLARIMIAAGLWLLSAGLASAEKPFAISVVDDQTGRGVPLVELRAVDQRRFVTDSAGLVAFDEPGLMNQKVFFTVKAHGYELPADGFGFHGKALVTTPGEQAELRVRRTNVAERLYRVTGAGIYRDSVLLQRPTPIKQPLLNAQVTGSDSVNSAVFRGKVYWFWGDTNRPAYPLGLFHVPGATSPLPTEGGLDPATGVNLDYFTRDDGFVSATAELPGEGPTWIDGLCVIADPERGERMFARYMKVRKFLEVYERGLVEWNDEQHRFEKVATFDFAAPAYLHGHPLPHRVNGVDYLYFGNPYPTVRVRARAKDLADPGGYESFTCLAAGTELKELNVERNSQGQVTFGWKRNTAPLNAADQARLVRSGKLKAQEALLALRDVESGKLVQAHSGTVTYNRFRQRFVMIALESAGTSPLGEIWYAEGDAPLGPWVYARKVVSHNNYSFYNPRQHPMFDQQDGRRIFFEGTYTMTFSGNDEPTPLYDYNQVMYGLDLQDPRLVLPVPIYRHSGNPGTAWTPGAERCGKATAAFMAPDRPREGLIPLRRATAGEPFRLTTEGAGDVAFYVMPADDKSSASATVPLFESTNGKDYWYAVEGEAIPQGYQRAARSLGRVWRFPLSLPPETWN